MTRNVKHPVTDRVRSWILAQPVGSVFTPTSVAVDMGREDLAGNSGTASKVLRTLIADKLAERTFPNGSGAPRGGYRLIPPPVSLATITPLLSCPTAETFSHLTDAERRQLDAIFKIQEDLHELRKSIYATAEARIA